MRNKKGSRSDRDGPSEDFGFTLVGDWPPDASKRRKDAGQEPGVWMAEYLTLVGASSTNPDRETGQQQLGRVYFNLDDWAVECVVVPEDGSPAIAALLIYPGDVDDLEKPRPVPRGGLSTSFLRRLHLAEVQRFARHELLELAQPQGPLADVVAAHGYRETELQTEPRPGRPAHPDAFYARIAAAYVQALDRKSGKPNEDVAKIMGYTAAYIRNAVSEARRRRLLTRTGQGQAGGILTEKGRRALEQVENLPVRPPRKMPVKSPSDWVKMNVRYMTPAKRRPGKPGPDLDLDKELGID